jgi:predicted ester cyclase
MDNHRATADSTDSTDGTDGTDNKLLVEAFIRELFTDGNLDAVDRYLDPGMVNHDLPFPGAPSGPEGMRHAAAMFRTALPDWHSDVEQLVAEGDLVVERFTASGTHSGVLLGVAPTGRILRLRGIQMFRIRNGKIVERWGRLDEAGLMRQLGLIPS